MIRFIYLEFANNEETKAEENSTNDETVVSTHKTMSVELKSKWFWRWSDFLSVRVFILHYSIHIQFTFNIQTS